MLSGRKFQSGSSEYLSSWERYALGMKKEFPHIKLADGGEMLYWGELSDGCIHCKKGKWDCIFITYACNLNCEFCISSEKIKIISPFSAIGRSWEEITANYQKTGIRGISFSGGEPFLKYEWLVTWLETLHKAFPHNYFWAYTNGLLIQEEQIDTLAGLGLNELRFNLAATGYNDRSVLAKVEYASRRIPNITVEIPAIYAHRDVLLPLLSTWAAGGVKYLNLHELMQEEASRSFFLEGDFMPLVLEDGHKTNVCMQSRILVKNILETIIKKNIPLNVNICSLANKLRQLRGRRKNCGLLNKKNFEKQKDNAYLETVAACKEGKECFYLHPDEYERKKQTYPGYEFFRLVRLAPLSVYQETCYFTKERIG